MSKKYITIAISAAAAMLLIMCLSLALGKSLEDGADETAKVAKSSEEPFSLLILGKDKVSGLTDVMMLASFDTENGRICVLQIPRDTYAEYSENHKKLNTATKVLGGEKKLCQFLSEALGVNIDGYLSLELEGFRKAVDAIGGVEMELERTLYYNDPAQDLYIYLQKGKQVLDGKKAEMLVRYRSGYVRGDLDRLDMQKRFLAALFDKMKASVNMSNAYELASSVFPYMDTNISLPAFVTLALKALKLDSSDIELMTLPGEDATAGSGGASYYVLSAQPTRRILEEYFVIKAEQIDKKRLFEHPSNEKFREIYTRSE